MGSAPASIILELAIISVTRLFLLKSGYKDLFCLLVFFFFFSAMGPAWFSRKLMVTMECDVFCSIIVEAKQNVGFLLCEEAELFSNNGNYKTPLLMHLT